MKPAPNNVNPRAKLSESNLPLRCFGKREKALTQSPQSKPHRVHNEKQIFSVPSVLRPQ